MSNIDFTGGNPVNTPDDQDQGQAGGGADAGANGADQGVIEYNGRKLTQEEVLKKLAHADSHIETLTAERQADRTRLEQLEEQVGRASKVEDVLKALAGGEGEPDPNEPAQPAQQQPQEVDLDSKLDELLNKREAAKREESNWNEVTGKLASVFGSKTNEKVAEVAAENDMTLEEAQAFARSKPKAFLKLFGNLEGRASTPLTPGSRNTNAFQPAPSAPSGYMDARTTKDQVAIYRQKLAQYGL